MIGISDLDFRYAEGDFALRIPHFAIAPGERVAMVGASGTGKTTLLHLIAGIVTPRAGRITTAGVEVSALDERARRDFRIRHVGLVFQEFELLEYLSVLDNILLPFRINPALTLDSAVRERACALAQRVGIGDKLLRLPDRLSHGERQRAAICRALVGRPSLLLADEPTGNLDPANAARVLDILFDYAGQSGATIVTVTHDHDLLDRFGRVIDVKTLHGASA